MIRLLLLLISGIGFAMYFADEIGGRNASAAPTESARKIEQQTTTASKEVVTLASLNAEPSKRVVHQARKMQPQRVPSNAANIVSFMNPVVVETDRSVMPEITEVAVAEPAKVAALTKPQIPVLYVTASRVNVRGGPSTANPVIGSVEFADSVQILSDPEQDWVMIRVEGDGVEGYVASKFLTDVNPLG